jgi:pimeloyl-ACP methyl ester carboxylesterase
VILTVLFLAISILIGSGRTAYAKDLGPLSGTPFEQFEVVDGLGRHINYYVSHPTKPAPLLLMIQGSGCTPAFVSSGGQIASTVFGAWPTALAGRFTVLVVDKPFSGEPPGAELGTATACSLQFNKDFSADRWLVALLAALKEAQRLPWVSPGRLFVLGHSEGAPMAAAVAGHDPDVTGVVFFAGPGDSQLFSTMLSAYSRGAITADRIENLERAEAQIRAIMADPLDATQFAWGHTYLRWSSFYRLSVLDQLRHSKAKVYIASGTADQDEPFLSTQILVAGLLADGRNIRTRVIPDADHSLSQPGEGASGQTAAEYAKALDWIVQP